MPTGNFESEPVPAPSPTPATRSFRLPADYYSAPLSEVRPIFPRWVPYGCGIAAALFLGLLFLAGAMLSGPALHQAFDFVIGMTISELRPMIATEIPAEQREAFEREVKTLREGLRGNRVQLARMQPFLQAMQKAVADNRVTPEELKQLTEAAKQASTPGREPSPR